MEEWKDIIGYEGKYQVSNLGRVRNNKGQILSQTLDPKSGYLRTHLGKNGKARWRLTHRLVAEVFINNPDGLPEINHKNEIKTDNRANNLEWCTRNYNANYGTRNQKISKSKQNDTKLSKKVRCIETNITYPSAMEAQRQTNVFATSIIKVCKGKAKIAGGYHWEYGKEM